MNPFFIVGAPRSGTTMLRDCFKRIDGLYSPEETHYFRWSCPFRGNEYNFIYENNRIIKKHRELDGVSDKEFEAILFSSKTKKELTDRYCELAAKKNGAMSWFEKTPQNVYGLPLLAEQYPDNFIVHIVRNPFSVIKSLLVGKVLKVDGLIGAANYWYESVAIVNVMRNYLGRRLLEVRYEDFVSSPSKEFSALCVSLGIKMMKVDLSEVSGGNKIDVEYFNKNDQSVIRSICEPYMNIYGYK